jgi:hypothetical protein
MVLGYNCWQNAIRASRIVTFSGWASSSCPSPAFSTSASDAIVSRSSAQAKIVSLWLQGFNTGRMTKAHLSGPRRYPGTTCLFCSVTFWRDFAPVPDQCSPLSPSSIDLADLIPTHPIVLHGYPSENIIDVLQVRQTGVDFAEVPIIRFSLGNLLSVLLHDLCVRASLAKSVP